MAGVVVVGRGEQIGGRAVLDHLAIGHDDHPVGHFTDHAKVMGDQHQGHAQAFLHIFQEVQDLRLNGHVEGGGRLVGDQDFRLVGQRHGDHHPLALAAGQLMGIVGEPAFGVANADQVEQFDGPCPRRLGFKAAMQKQTFANLLFDFMQRVERGHRLLKIIEIRLPRISRMTVSSAPNNSRPSKRIEPAGWRAFG